MQITQIQANYLTNPQLINNRKLATNTPITQHNETKYAQIPVTHKFGANIHFGEFFDPNRTVPHIDYEEYMAMNETTKKRFRKRYKNFFQDKTIDTSQMIDKNFTSMPLQSKNAMDEFLKTAKIYSKYKDHPIICLGRSPKWFLNTALWMKNGIDDYKYVAFSKYWYNRDMFSGEIERCPGIAPTAKEEEAYRKYLKRIKADPKTIVENMQKTGKKTIITDYISTGKGVTSFLDILSKYAQDLGILEEFCNSIHIVGIGSLKHLEEELKRDVTRTPRVTMPDRMLPYEMKNLWTYNITQEFHNIDYDMFREMLINQNTNECRSTYYPHETWTLYQPDRFKTGLIKDMKKVKELLKVLKKQHERSISSFAPAMYDYRNLLNFRILDALNARKLLKTIHKSKI